MSPEAALTCCPGGFSSICRQDSSRRYVIFSSTRVPNVCAIVEQGEPLRACPAPIVRPEPSDTEESVAARLSLAERIAPRLGLVVALDDVFGISANVDSRSYVDRGGLDERFRRALGSQRHVAVHGGSKQGKSWLRTKGLRDNDAIVVQCQPNSTGGLATSGSARAPRRGGNSSYVRNA